MAIMWNYSVLEFFIFFEFFKNFSPSSEHDFILVIVCLLFIREFVGVFQLPSREAEEDVILPQDQTHLCAVCRTEDVDQNYHEESSHDGE